MNSKRSIKRRISLVDFEANIVPVSSHKQVKMEKRGWCVCCKGLRFGDKPQKRVAMAEIEANQRRPISSHLSFLGAVLVKSICVKRGVVLKLFIRVEVEISHNCPPFSIADWSKLSDLAVHRPL